MRRATKKVLYQLGRILRRGLEKRLFYAIFQVTRVTNDHYGWRPDKDEEQP